MIKNFSLSVRLRVFTPGRAAWRTIAVGWLLVLALAESCSAGLRISEFLAGNDGGYRDADGDSPDWIELLNDAPGAVSLAGWHLTDSPTNLTKWTFPATNLPSGALLVVFASGKDRALAGTELHANFQLDQAGGYLALVQPDGVSIAQAFNYPAQRANVSFGRAQQVTTTVLLATGAAARVFVPSNDTLGLAWTARVFDDSDWLATNAPVRFVVGAVTNTLLAVDFNERGQDEAALTLAGFQSFLIDSNISSTAIQTQATTRVFGGLSLTVSNTSPFGYDDRLRTTPINSGSFTESLLLRDFIYSLDTTGTGGLDVVTSGLMPNRPHRLTVWSYDSGSPNNRVSNWSINGVVVTNGYTFNGSILPTSNARYSFGLDATTDGSGRILLSGRRSLTSLANSPAVFLDALQVSELATVSPTNGLASLMISNTATAYLRVPFTVADPAAISALTLRIRYDDGFVAYLNGQPVASRNAPAQLAWDSSATAAHSEASAEDIVIVPSPGLLVAGLNVLAVQGLNASAADPDFTLAPELLAQQIVDLGDRYFQPPTPGTNNAAGFTGLVADTKFSVNRGFYDASFALRITNATPGAEIRYTTNGTAPSSTSGFLYSGPIIITGQSFIRAAAFKTGLVPSDVDTHSYIFLRDVLRQSNNIPNYPTSWQASYPADYGMDSNIVKHPVYGATISNDLRSIATLCLVTEHNGLWHSSTGIYPNATSSGPAWERAASMELINGSGATEFAVNARMQMHGNASRDNNRTPKHSIGIIFNSAYGPSKLRHDWFGGDAPAEHDKIILRSCGFVDGWAGRYADDGLYTSTETGETFRGLRYRPETTCYLRDAWMKDSFRAMGWSASRSQFVHLYLNGLYWGLYEPSERPDASFFSQLHGGAEQAWDVIVGEDNNGPPVLVDGSLTDWQNVLNLVNAGITTEAAYQSVAQLVDLDNLIDYMLLHVFGEAEDWPRHNWYVAHRRATNGVPATKFICTVWDQELTLDRLVRRNRLDVGNSGGEVYSPARIYAQFRAWPEFRRQFGDRIQKHFFNGGALAPSNNIARLLAPAALLRDALTGESARWGDARKTPTPGGVIGTGQTFTRDEWWQPEIDKLTTNFFQKLTADNVARFRAGSLYPNVGAPNFSQFGGGVPAGFGLTLSHTNASGVLYFTTDESDPRTYGTGTVAPGAQSYASPVVINAPTLIRARVLSGGAWSALVEAVFYPPQDLSKLALTEIMYHAPDSGLTNGDEFEFLELKNTGTNVLNLSGLTFNGVGFTFTNGTLLAPGAFFVLARNPVAFAGKYPGVAVRGAFSGNLNNGGEALTLSHALGVTIFSVTYDDEAAWPVTADDFGFSLVPKHPGTAQAPDSGAAWRASTNPGGSPGADDPEPFIAPILINEVLTASVPPDVDRIELFNPTETDVDIGGWFLSDDHTAPKKYRIADGTMISAGDFAVFTEAQFNATPGTNGGFSLSSRGESVYLSSGDATTNLTGYSHGLAFDAAAPGVSFGRYVNSVDEEQFPAQIAPTFAGVNAGPRVGPVVISEIHYHPAPGGDEFIELQNLTSGPVPLFDPAHPANAWRLNGLGYEFPTNLTLDAGARLLLVATNPPGFRAKYGVAAEVLILGPYTGELQDSGERLRLERPDAPDTNGLAYLTVDEVRFNDKAPWPPAADGSGPSLQRIDAAAYGNDPVKWMAAGATPGRSLATADTDGDELPDVWEQVNGTNPLVNDASDDRDGDGQTNLEEYLAGTDPNEASSYLKVDQITIEAGAAVLQFTAVADRSYSILASGQPGGGTWTSVATVVPQPATMVATVTNVLSGGSRFFRLVTPAVP